VERHSWARSSSSPFIGVPVRRLGARPRSADRAAIDSLAAQHREIIDLVYDQGKSIAEIAALLRIPADTVKTRMFYARQRLAALVRQKFGHEINYTV
jgi:DNA-directed RNA polymerase specialized sigma24 family protein